MENKTVNRKEFHYLLSKFLQKHRLAHIFYDCSIKYKMDELEKKNFFWWKCYRDYNINKEDDFSTHLYKCIDIYCNELYVNGTTFIGLYDGDISGFFNSIPATFFFYEEKRSKLNL
jgi:hypothetical protein